MPVDPEIPIPELIRQLQGMVAWKLIIDRLDRMVDQYHRRIRELPPSTDPREIQRLIGFAQGLEMLVRDPKRLQLEWEREFKKTQKAQRAAE